MKKKLALVLAATMLCASLLSACGGSASSGDAKKEEAPAEEAAEEEAAEEEPATAEAQDEKEIVDSAKTEDAEEPVDQTGKSDTLVVYSSGAFAGQWDPTANTILSNKHAEWQSFDHCLYFDPDTKEIGPSVCDEFGYLEDGYTLQLHVREGIKFHDGSDLTAEDIAATLEYTTRPDSGSFSYYAVPLKTEVLDDYTLNVWPENEVCLAGLTTLLCSESILSKDDIENGTLNDGYNGSGPYKFVKYENETIFFEANEDYWDEENKAKIPYVQYKYVAEPATRLSALQAGEAQVIERVDIEQVPIIEADDTIDYAKIYADEQKYIIFKCTQAPMDNVDLRKAISYAVDRETIVNDIMQGYAVLADSYVSHVSNLYAVAEGMPTYDPEKAKEYLEKAGYPNGEGLEPIYAITSTGFYPKTKEYWEYMVSNWADVGIPVNLVVEESAVWEAHLYEEDSCQMCDTGWMNTIVEGNAVVGPHYQSPGRCNFSSYPEVDEVIVKESAINDPAERVQYMHDEVYPKLVETNTNMPLFDSVMVYGYSKDIGGGVFLPTSHVPFNKIYFK